MATENMLETRSASISKLTGMNYATWSYQMKLVLMECDLWTTVQPGETKPEENDVENVRKFTSRQGKALAKICLGIGDEQQQHVQHLNSPKEVWEELQRLYAPKDSKFRVIQLRRQLYSEKLSEHTSMDSYLGKVNRMVFELTSIGDRIEDGDLAMTILCGLSDDWDEVVSALCNLPESEFTCATVKRRLLAESERRGNAGAKEGSAMVMNEANHGRMQHYTARGRRHSKKINEKCYNCGRKGHYAKDCRSKKTVPEKSKRGVSDLLVACGTLVEDSHHDTWVIDSGATHHMTPNRNYFTTLKECDHDVSLITTADGTTTPTAGKGIVHAKIVNNSGELNEFTAKNTILVPGIKYGVLSVLQMTENNRKVVFDGEGCHIYNEQGAPLIEAKKQDRLFLIKTAPLAVKGERQSEQHLAVKDSPKETLDLWHRRLMHVGKERIIRMSKEQSVVGLNCEETNPTKCDDCLKGKSARQPFPKYPERMKKETDPLALVHSDLMGPFDVESWGKSRYVLTIIDEATRYVHVAFIRNKDDALGKFKIWMQEAEKLTQKTLKRIRTDNGLEFCSREWDKFCEARGIVHERTMVYTPQQNGVAERMNRTLLDLVRSTLSSCNLPKAAWAELTNTAAYIRNRVTNKNNESETPYELWFQRKPSIRHLRACGCEVYVHIPKQRRKSKLAVRAQNGLLVGYALRGHGWRVWLQEKHQVVESRDCVFKEDTVPGTYPHHLTTRLPKVRYPLNESSSRECEDEDRDREVPEAPKLDEMVNREVGERVNEMSPDRASIPLPPEKRGRCNPEPKQRCHPMTLRSQTQSEKDKAESEAQQTNMANISVKVNDLDEPSSYQQAIESSEAPRWLEAMQEEIESLKEHNVWDLAELPKGTKPVKCRWVFQKKINADGNVIRYKARLVAKGYTQRKGFDFDEVYTPVSSFETIRLLTAIGVEENWVMEQYDVKSAYLHGKLDQTVYMEQPEGFITSSKEHLCCKLRKSIYGLRQSGRCWNEHLDECLKKSGFRRNPVDPCVYEVALRKGRSILAVYVDDILCLSENQEVSNEVKVILNKYFKCRSEGEVSYLLGVKFEHGENGSVRLSQEAYVDRMLHRFGMTDAKTAQTPMELRPDFIGDKETNSCPNVPYRELIGSLLYLAQRTRPDIAFAVGKLAQNSANFSERHWTAAKRILRYVKATKGDGITYHQTGEPLVAFADADWATCPETRRSTTGYVIMLAGAPVLWRSTKQTVVALSTMEAEYVALASCVQDITWIRELLKQVGLEKFASGPTQIKCDSQAAISHANSYIDKSRTKHIAIKYHFLRDKVSDGTAILEYVPSKENTADVLTKSLCQQQHEFHRERMMNMRSEQASKITPRGGLLNELKGSL